MLNNSNDRVLGVEFYALAVALQRRDERGMEAAAQSICTKYAQLKEECIQLRKVVSRLEMENQQLLEDARTLHPHPAALQIDDAALYEDWLKTKSFRKTGANFGCDKETVKRHLIRAGYIK